MKFSSINYYLLNKTFGNDLYLEISFVKRDVSEISRDIIYILSLWNKLNVIHTDIYSKNTSLNLGTKTSCLFKRILNYFPEMSDLNVT